MAREHAEEANEGERGECGRGPEPRDSMAGEQEDSEGMGEVPTGLDRRGSDSRGLPPEAAASIAAAEAAAMAAQGTVPTMPMPGMNLDSSSRQNMAGVHGEAGPGGAQPWPGFDKFAVVQNILDSNRLLVHEIKHNHKTRDPDGLIRNVALIRELNENVARVVELYGEISETFVAAFGDVPYDTS